MGKRIENWKCGAPMNVLRRADLSHGARLLYAILCGYMSKKSPHPFPSEGKLAKDLGCDRRTISRFKNELKFARLIDWKKRRGSNIYTVNTDTGASSDTDMGVSPIRTQMSGVYGQACPPNGNRKNVNQLNASQQAKLPTAHILKH
jgi:hypothetical protein